MSEYVFSMYRADKFYGPDRQVLANISLSFLPGREDRRARAERRGQVDAAADHGRARGAVERRRPTLAPGRDGRHARAGARARRGARTCAATSRTACATLRDLLDRFDEICAKFAEPDADFDALLAEQAKVQEQIDRRDAWSLDATLDRAMDALRLPDGDRDVETLSGGERRRVALCRLLLSAPDLLLLDEPTNHLDAESVAWLERFLADYKGTVVAVTHDRYFLDNVAGWILELDRGAGLPFQGNYSSWLEQKQARLAVEEKTESARRRTLAARARVGAHEPARAPRQVEGAPRRLREALRRGAGREARPGRDPHPARAAARRRRDRGRRRREGLRRPAALRGPVVLAAAGRHRRRRRPERRRQDDALPHDRGRGEARRGHAAASATRCSSPTSTSRARGLDPKSTVWKEISGGHDIDRARQARGELAPVRELVQLPRRRPAEARSADLSGGERNRVHLAKLLRSGGNVLLLDEPTNDLDVDTLRALEEALLDFAGCAVVITPRPLVPRPRRDAHPRVRGRQQATWFEGTWGEYADWVKETRGAEALEPHRIKYKPLVRA